jgi:hypothetical protein
LRSKGDAFRALRVCFAGQDHTGGELEEREPGHHGGAGPPLPRVRPGNAPPSLRRPQEPLHGRDPPVRRARVHRAPHRRRLPASVRTYICSPSPPPSRT